MPTPIGHALGGVAAGCLMAAVARRRGRPLDRAGGRAELLARWGLRRAVITFALLGMAADVDFLFGVHRSVTHSVGATLVVAAAAAAWLPGARLTGAAVVAAAYGSHVAIDWLGTDPGAPFGVMALWPWTHDFYLSELHLFMRICRDYAQLACWVHNAAALARELVILAPLALATVVGARVALRATAAGPDAAGNPE